MSTLNCDKKRIDTAPPRWALSISEKEYHAAALRGEIMSSGMLKEFRICPAHYCALVEGRTERAESDAFRFGRAVHKLILEGDAAYRAAFAVGGPINERTGKAFGAGSKAFDEWLRENGLERRDVLTESEAADAARMCDAVRGHSEAASLLAEGWAEMTARSEMAGVDCQMRLDWLRYDGTAIDLKTIEDIGRFETDARRFGYLHQFAFYRDVARAAGGCELAMAAVVLEKKPPFRVGVWHFSADVLEPYAVQNRQTLAAYRRCRENDRWPTGYESPRAFPLAGIPPVWLN